MQTSITKKARAFLLVGVLMSTAAYVQAVEIRGSRSCGVWVSDKGTVQAPANEAWLIGFLSGMAFFSNKNILDGTDNKSLALWVDNYCRANPLKKLYEAGDSLFEELVIQKRL